MAYVSLYRKYRPQTFDDVVGQTPVIRTLANAIAEDRLHHAYLFTGPRGTGKTSTARILAKAINCEQGPTATPCNTCRQCVEITDGSSVDVIELDMASHGGVDDARELRDRALFAPASARRKVYILDEVHMASTAAFNALLKLIEEPPAHVMFAMATTDPQKVLPTIMSRVQRLDLRRVSAAEVAGNVRRLCELEGYTIDAGAVEAIVRAGDGSLRDTQSVLEQVLAFAGTDVAVGDVAQVLGQTPVQRVVEVVDLLAARDVAGLLAAVQGLVDEGHDLRRFTLDLVQHVRDLLVLGAAPDRPDLVDATEERRGQLESQAAAMPPETLLRAVTVLAATVSEQRLGSPRLPLELALASLVVPSESAQLRELTDRVARLEAGMVPAAAVAPPVAPPVAAPSVPDQPVADPVDPAPPPEVSESSAPSAPAEPARRAAATAAAAVAPDQATERAPVGDPLPAGDPPPADDAPVDGPAASEDPAPADPPEIDPSPPEEVPEQVADTEHVDADAPEPSGPEDDLARITRQWDTILEVVRDGSRRHHAIFLPATPTRAGRGILTLRYGRRYASFHAANAGSGAYADALQSAVEQVTGLRVRLEIVVDGDDDRRRPVPPSVTPDDARTPVFHESGGHGAAGTASDTGAPHPDDGARTVGHDAPTEADEVSDVSASAPPEPAEEPVDDEAAVREAEFDAPTAQDPQAVGRLLADELGAELVDELPPPSEHEA